jgi:hypothetical protein
MIPGLPRLIPSVLRSREPVRQPSIRSPASGEKLAPWSARWRTSGECPQIGQNHHRNPNFLLLPPPMKAGQPANLVMEDRKAA